MTTHQLADLTELRAGDILLCYKDVKIDPVGKKITRVTDSEYTHAAICIDANTAAESLTQRGVTKTKIQDLVGRYDHVAVFRQPDAWHPDDRVKALNIFIDSIISSKAKYNFQDVLTFRKRHEIHKLSLSEQLQAFFEGRLAPSPIEKGSYFCSELVADCFVASGFIEPSAAIVYKSNVTSPGALGRDPTFGTFYGYVSLVPNYAVPSADEFVNETKYSEIFGANT
jgi:hypothetical protein